VHAQHEFFELCRPRRRLQEGRVFQEEWTEGAIERLQS
jgi:hypothetical protein